MCQGIINFRQDPVPQKAVGASLGTKSGICPRAPTVSRATVESFVVHFCEWAAKRGLGIEEEEARKWIEDKLYIAGTAIIEEEKE